MRKVMQVWRPGAEKEGVGGGGGVKNREEVRLEGEGGQQGGGWGGCQGCEVNREGWGERERDGSSGLGVRVVGG